MNNQRKTVWLVSAALMVAGWVMLSTAWRASDNPSGASDQISKLLSQVKAEGVELKLDAEDMDSFAHSKLSWESHASKISVVKNHINKAGSLLAQLGALRTNVIRLAASRH